MTGLLEDILTEDDIRAIEAVQTSDDFGFDALVAISGLNPKEDFRYSDLRYLDMRGADLRGYNFSGSDLRQCVINSKTLIDRTTILDGALLDWIEADALPIVQQMQGIEIASTSDRRRELIADLIAEYGRSVHVISYLTRAAGNAKELDQFLDYVTQLPVDLTVDQLSVIRAHGRKLLSKKFRQAKNRTRRDRTAIFALEPIVARLKDSPGELGRVVLGLLAEVVNDKDQTKALRGTATLEPADFEAAFSRLGQTKLR